MGPEMALITPAMVSPDAREAPLFPAFIHYKAADEAVSLRKRSSSFSGYIPYALKDFADELARCHNFGQLACATTPSSENDGASEVRPDKTDAEQNSRSRRRRRATVGVPAMEQCTDKNGCSRGGVHADKQAEDVFDANFNLVTKSHVKASCTSLPSLLLSQTITSNMAEVYETPIEKIDLTRGDQRISHKHHQDHKVAACQEVTTIMIRNLPAELSQTLLLQELDRCGFQDQYDLVYLPHEFVKGKNLGFAFVNFTTASAAQSLIDQWHRGDRWFTHKVYGEGLNLSPASVQGVDSNLKQWLGARGKRIRNPRFRPYVAAQHAEKAQAIAEDK